MLLVILARLFVASFKCFSDQSNSSGFAGHQYLCRRLVGFNI